MRFAFRLFFLGLEQNNQRSECEQGKNTSADKHISKFEAELFNFNERNKSVKTPKLNREFVKFLDNFTYLEHC
jgi:hypothetical protein